MSGESSSMLSTDSDSDDGVDGRHELDRMQQLLTQYYGVETTEEGRVETLRDLDSSAFDVDRWVKRALKKQQLSALLRKDAELTSEIRSIDSDMKMLVHENYNKFITASGTIKKMSADVEGMETKVGKLVADMEVLTASAAAVEKNLESRRAEISKLMGVRRLLKRLEFLFDLPLRLRRSVELKACVEVIILFFTAYPSGMKKTLHTFSTMVSTIKRPHIIQKSGDLSQFFAYVSPTTCACDKNHVFSRALKYLKSE